MINLSSRQLTENEENVLNRGLGFVITDTGDPFLTQVEMAKFFRMIRLHFFFAKNTEDTATVTDKYTGLKGPSCFNPPTPGLPAKVLTFEQAVESDLKKLYQQEHRPFVNLPKREQEALKSLIIDDSLTIKPADKGYCLA